jgi:hypothetical protein
MGEKLTCSLQQQKHSLSPRADLASHVRDSLKPAALANSQYHDPERLRLEIKLSPSYYPSLASTPRIIGVLNSL